MLGVLREQNRCVSGSGCSVIEAYELALDQLSSESPTTGGVHRQNLDLN